MNTKIRAHQVLGALAAACLAACGGGNDTASASASTEALQNPTRAVTVAAATSGSTIVVRARATLAGGVGATMVVRAEGQILGSVTVNNVGTSQDYRFDAPVALGAGARVDVVFVNDGVTVVNGVRTEDRNLIVETITVDGGAPVAANASGVVVDKGDGSAAFDGLDTVPGQSGLWWNGALRIVLPASTTPAGHTLTVRASASLAGGVGAQMVVRVDGQVVGNAAVNNVGAAQAYTFALATAPATGAKVDVAFTNDGVTVVNGVRTEDRNLYVESIAVDGGTPIKPNESGVTLDRGTGTAAYDGVDVIPGQSALAWNGALRFTVPGASVPATGNKITVRARTVYPMGTGAQMTVRHNGVLLTALVVNATGITPEPIDFGVAQDYVVQSPLPVRDGDTIDVAVLNAGSASACTGTTCGVRELVVEGVSVNDREPIPATAPDVVFDRGDGAAAFDGQNVGPGQQSLAENGALRFKVRPQAASMPIAARVQAVRLAFQGVATSAAAQTSSCYSGTVDFNVVLTQDISTPIDATFRLVTKAGTQDFSYQDCTDPGNFSTRTGSVHREFQSSTVIPPGNTSIPDSSSSIYTLSQWRLSKVNKALVPLKPASAGVLVNGKANLTSVQDPAYPWTNPTYNYTWILQPGTTLTDPTTSAQASVVAGQINEVSGGFGTVSSSTPVNWTFDLAGRRYVVSGRMEQYWGDRFGNVMSYRGSYEVRSNGELIGEARVIDTMRNPSAPASHAYVFIDGFTYPI